MTVVEDPTYALVDGRHLHHFPAWEVCNLDDARELATMTQFEVDQRELLHGAFNRCEHCWPATDPLRDDPPEDVAS